MLNNIPGRIPAMPGFAKANLENFKAESVEPVRGGGVRLKGDQANGVDTNIRFDSTGDFFVSTGFGLIRRERPATDAQLRDLATSLDAFADGKPGSYFAAFEAALAAKID